jgi:glucosamine-6-phosphate deaminase
MENLLAGQLMVSVAQNRQALGNSAAGRVIDVITAGLQKKKRIRIVFAAAPSQNEMLAALTAAPGVDWSRIDAFHMDEYLGLPAGAPQLFGSYLKKHLFSKVTFGSVHLIDGQAADSREECARYAALLEEAPIDLACMGIGENGHVAFNDPPVADFDDRAVVKVVRLDEACRQQQVNDGCFPSLDLVPRLALTMTVPALMKAACLSAAVPGSSKAEAVRQTIEGPIATSCPASILRTHGCACLFLDTDSASRLKIVNDSRKAGVP